MLNNLRVLMLGLLCLSSMFLLQNTNSETVSETELANVSGAEDPVPYRLMKQLPCGGTAGTCTEGTPFCYGACSDYCLNEGFERTCIYSSDCNHGCLMSAQSVCSDSIMLTTGGQTCVGLGPCDPCGYYLGAGPC